jgi:integrase
MGPAEVGGLAVADVSLGGEVPFVWVRQNSVRRLKTSARTRQVPLVGVALEAAQDAVERAGERKEMFTGYGASGRGADFLSATLNAALRRAGVPRSPRLTSYSFRHGMVEALRVANVQEDMRRRLLGHAARDVHGKYGATNPQLVEARDAMEKALDHLGDIDDSVYSEAARLD